MTWWPVVLILLAAPFVTYGYGWVERQALLAAHSRQLGAERAEADRQVKAAYGKGHVDGIAEVRATELAEIEKTREAMRWLEVELEASRAANVPPSTPAAIRELCKRSASCRDRKMLK